jgi:DNA replication protein DnaC
MNNEIAGIQTPLDQPEPMLVRCRLCTKPFTANFYWVYDRWLRPTVHDKCAEEWSKAEKARDAEPPKKQPIPERFTSFDPLQADQKTLSLAQSFGPDSNSKALVIIGPPGRGKSRIMWAVIQQFFGELEACEGARRWVDYYTFSDLVSESDKSMLSRVKHDRYVFIDDVGSCDCYGRERATLQNIIRTRVQKQQWTWLTIDNMDFDPDLDRVLDGRAVKVWMLK